MSKRSGARGRSSGTMQGISGLRECISGRRGVEAVEGGGVNVRELGGLGVREYGGSDGEVGFRVGLLVCPEKAWDRSGPSGPKNRKFFRKIFLSQIVSRVDGLVRKHVLGFGWTLEPVWNQVDFGAEKIEKFFITFLDSISCVNMLSGSVRSFWCAELVLGSLGSW